MPRPPAFHRRFPRLCSDCRWQHWTILHDADNWTPARLCTDCYERRVRRPDRLPRVSPYDRRQLRAPAPAGSPL